MKIGIVGSREFQPLSKVREYIEKLSKDIIIVSGGARGVDSFAEFSARQLGLQVEIYYPDWRSNGRQAGFIRNTNIVINSDRIVAFWDGKSRGTQDTIKKAKEYGKEVEIIQ